jgi:ABC-type amino acid transport substrate-binding protein
MVEAQVAAARAASPSTHDTDRLVAVLMALPDIKSVADLAGKTIAIDNRYSASNGSVRTAIVAAGASEIQLNEGQTTAINRLTNGEVPAAVLALVTAEAAEGFPRIAGFNIFHIPLSPRALKPQP